MILYLGLTVMIFCVIAVSIILVVRGRFPAPNCPVGTVAMATLPGRNLCSGSGAVAVVVAGAAMFFAPSAQLRISHNILKCEDSVDVVARLGACVRWLIAELYIIEVGKTAKRQNGVLLLYAPFLRLICVFVCVCPLSFGCVFFFFFFPDRFRGRRVLS